MGLCREFRYTEDALDERGNKTPQYYKMQECNADLKRLSPVYMRYTASNQTMLNADAQGSELDYFIAKNPLEAMGHKTITNLAVAEEKDVLVGFYEKNLGEGEAFLFVNADKNCVMNNAPTTTTVSFKTVSPASVVTAYVKGVPTILTPVDGVYTIQVVDADAVFVTVSEPASLNPKPVFPVGQITIGGTDISEFTIVIPAKATVRERQAAEAIADVIAKATGKTLLITTDAATPAHAISLGKTTLASAASGLSLASLKGDGYALMMDGTHLYISGNDAPGAGTLFGVYGFCEDHLGVGFYADDYVTIPTAQSITVDEGINEVHNPAFLLREASNYVAADQTYPLYQKYNGMSVYGDTNFGADMTGGGSMIALTGCLYETDRACLTNEMTYTAILRNAKRVLACDPDAEYLTCDLPLNPEDSDVTIPCTCENCTAIIDSEGIMGLALTIVNRLANDLRADYPNLLISTLAMGKSLQIPTTVRPAENVMIRVAMPISACRFHGLGDESCEVNASFRNTLKEWTEICDTVFLLDQATERSTNHIYTCPVDHNGNPLALFDTIQYLRELGIAGYQQTGYDTPSADMEAMHNYLLSHLLWDEDITREEYEQEMDGFLKAYYGAGWSYIRQYIDMVYKTDGVTHQEGSTDMAIIFRLNDKAFAKECFRLWNAAIDAAETAIFRRNTEIDSLQMYAVARESRILLQVRYFERLLNRYNFVVS